MVKQYSVSIPKIVQLPSGTFRCQLRLGGESMPVCGETEREVALKATQMKAEWQRDKKKAKKTPKGETLKMAIAEYIESRRGGLSPATIRGYINIKNNRFKGLMDLQLQAISTERLNDEIKKEIVSHSAWEKEKQIKPKTVINAVGLIKSVLISNKVDIDWDNITLPKKYPYMPTIITPAHIRSLFSLIKGTDLELPVLILAWFGIRASELAALTKESFDFVGKTVIIKDAMVPDEHNKMVLHGGTKNATSTRRIGCPDVILDKVAELPAGARIITIHPNGLRNRIYKVCKDNGLPQIGLHALRHANASIMLMLNIPDKYAMSRGGWASKDTMTKIYQYEYDEVTKKTNQRIDDYFESLLAPEK